MSIQQRTYLEMDDVTWPCLSLSFSRPGLLIWGTYDSTRRAVFFRLYDGYWQNSAIRFQMWWSLCWRGEESQGLQNLQYRQQEEEVKKVKDCRNYTLGGDVTWTRIRSIEPNLVDEKWKWVSPYVPRNMPLLGGRLGLRKNQESLTDVREVDARKV